MPPPRDVEARLAWFLGNKPSGVGMCAQHSWRSLGGDRGNPPAWGAANANQVYDKVKASGRYFTTDPPRGALVLWKYGKHGHAALSAGGGKIATTDPTNKPGGVGLEPLNYPARWGAKGYIWTDQYAGVRFPVTTPTTAGGPPMALWYKYSGKPSGRLRLPGTGAYMRLDATIPAPPRKGHEHRMVYLNVSPTWKLPKTDPMYAFQTASLRVRWTRAGAKPDPTGYQDFTITPHRAEYLLTHIHWELGEKSRGGRWSVSLVGHASSALIGTRYTKGAVA